MKKILILSGVACMTLIGACKKVKQLANINVNIPYTQQFSVPAVAGFPEGFPLPPGGIALPFPSVPFATNSKAEIAKYNTSTDKIISVDLKSMNLQILTPPGQNFDYLDTIRLYVSAPTQQEMLVAYAYNIPKGVSQFDLTTVSSVNLKNYFIQDTMSLRMESHINALPKSGEELNLSSTFHLVANPLE